MISVEELQREFESLSIEPQKTGITYHLDMLKHSHDPDPDKEQSHVEQPLRLKRIIERLKSQNLLSRCDVIDNMEEIDWQHVIKAHGEEYVNYLQNLWKETKKHKITVVDTYYTKASIRAARLAAEATRISAEKVWKGEWKNSFSIVRPPGHHAAAKENKICGFCFINNVVTAALYLQNTYNTKRIVILDWDVHHGDSSQLLTYDNPNILYISIHRYSNGVFYPGESGDLNYTGKDKGEGFNLNFPLNPQQNQFVSDAEYIYAFERAIFPIMKDFEPEFVFISSGFDCLLGDPLGALQVTQDALSYMLYRIMNSIQSKICIALEGGYNLEKISIASECLIHVLLGHYYPNPANNVQTDFKNLYKYAQPNKIFFQNTKDNIDVWKKYWPILETTDLLKYEADIKAAIENEGNMIVVNSKDIQVEGDFILKKASAAELKFFGEQYPLLPKLHSFFPKLYGIKEKDAVLMIKFENMLKTANYSILHIKLADSYKPQMADTAFLEKYRCYVPGYVIKNGNGEVIEKRIKVFNKIDENHTTAYVKRFFAFKSFGDAKQVIDKITGFVQKLRNIVYIDKLNLSSASIVILYDPGVKQIMITLMNIDHFAFESNQNLLIVLDGIKTYFEDFLKSYQNKFKFEKL